MLRSGVGGYCRAPGIVICFLTPVVPLCLNGSMQRAGVLCGAAGAAGRRGHQVVACAPLVARNNVGA